MRENPYKFFGLLDSTFIRPFLSQDVETSNIKERSGRERINCVRHDRLVTGARITGDFRVKGSSLDYRGAGGNATVAADTSTTLVDNALGRIKANSDNPIANSSTYASLMTVIERNL